ncbi:MAG: HAD family hydrolase [Faecalibacillus intestinalis]|uniref:HAD family hydrolase n=1 Tax=Faecalibacillus intestinalis TaxID=1982626 RepID=UPI0039A0E6C2
MKYFNGIVCGSEVEHGKPAPDIFLKACDKLNVEPEEALVLEDSEAGIQAASEAKISVICIPDMKFPQEKYLKVEHVYDSLEDVVSYLEMKKIFQNRNIFFSYLTIYLIT